MLELRERDVILAGVGVAVIVGGALAFVLWRNRESFNPASENNLAYRGLNAAGAALTGNPDFNAGAALWENPLWLPGVAFYPGVVIGNALQRQRERAVLSDVPRAPEAVSIEDPWKSTW